MVFKLFSKFLSICSLFLVLSVSVGLISCDPRVRSNPYTSIEIKEGEIVDGNRVLELPFGSAPKSLNIVCEPENAKDSLVYELSVEGSSDYTLSAVSIDKSTNKIRAEEIGEKVVLIVKSKKKPSVRDRIIIDVPQGRVRVDESGVSGDSSSKPIELVMATGDVPESEQMTFEAPEGTKITDCEISPDGAGVSFSDIGLPNPVNFPEGLDSITVEAEKTDENNGKLVELTITLDDGTQRKCNIVIGEVIPVARISVEKSVALLAKGETVDLNAVAQSAQNGVAPTYTKLLYASSDVSVATVNENGVVTAQTDDKTKSCTITIKSEKYQNISESSMINIKSTQIETNNSKSATLPIPEGRSVPTSTLPQCEPSDKGHVEGDNEEGYKFVFDDSVEPGTLVKVTVTLDDGTTRTYDVIYGQIIPTTGITVTNSSSFEMSPGESKQIEFTIAPSNSTYKNADDMIFTSSNTSIATVDEQGLVTLSPNAPFGKSAVITVTTKNGTSTTFNVTNNVYNITDTKDEETGSLSSLTITPTSGKTFAENGYTVTPEGSAIFDPQTGKLTISPSVPDGTLITSTITYSDGSSKIFSIIKNQEIKLTAISVEDMSIGYGNEEEVNPIFTPANATYKGFRIEKVGDTKNVIDDSRTDLNAGVIATLDDENNVDESATFKAVSTKYSNIESNDFEVTVALNRLTDAVSLSSLSELTLYAQSSNSDNSSLTGKKWNGTIQYSFDKKNWQTWYGGKIISSTKTKGVDNNGEDRYYIYLRGTGNSVITNVTGTDNSGIWKINTNTSDVIVNGNMQNLLEYNPTAETLVPTMSDYCFSSIFINWGKLTSLGDDFELPMTSLSDHCYYRMFYNCSSLTSLPANFTLPAETLADYCYCTMFYNCSSLTSLPANFTLPAETLADHCYGNMFYNCSFLTSLPANFTLPAETLADYCYASMFYNCTSLTSLPANFTLRANTLARGCYFSMFYCCSKLKFSTSNTGNYANAKSFTIGTGGDSDSVTSMFIGTGGSFTGTPSKGSTIYFL